MLYVIIFPIHVYTVYLVGKVLSFGYFNLLLTASTEKDHMNMNIELELKLLLNQLRGSSTEKSSE